MKFLSSQLAFFLQSKSTRRNIRLLIRFIIILLSLITFYSILFHFIMELEGEYYTWVTGFYWTLTVMSTLGFGDITFTSDLGRIFSIIVLLSGVIFLLVLLPFTFIQSRIRQETGCTVVAVKSRAGTSINPDPALPFMPEDEIILIGNTEAEKRFIRKFSA